jgi:ATP-dependent DNA helicase RecG
VHTVVRRGGQRERVLAFVHDRCAEGGQAYIVFPVIEESEQSDLRAAATAHASLEGRWPDLRVGLVHGRLRNDERDAVMRRFRSGELHVLVATTVIEVGIDVPNASVMVVEHAERFGLAQLHQLRGRIGRGAAESHCILLTDQNIPGRLRSFAATTDGFRIAELDLAERGMGDLIGARQAGSFELRQARLPDDADLLTRARDAASSLLADDPTLRAPANRALRERALSRYPRAVELFRVG